jgi:hypothetical protein
MRRATLLQVLIVTAALVAFGSVAFYAWPVFTDRGGNELPRRRPIDTLALEPAAEGEADQPTPTTMPSADDLFSQAAPGVHVVRSDPPGVPIPEGAKRLFAVVRVFPGERQQLGRYLVNEPPAVLESYYRKEMADAGWRPSHSLSSDAMFFVRGRQRCRIELTVAPGGTRLTAVLAVTEKQD